jgi:hypothetical protein
MKSLDIIIRTHDKSNISKFPSLVLHMQSSLQEDSYIDWKYWWNTYTHKAKHFELSYL